jgi:hypothetical protein
MLDVTEKCLEVELAVGSIQWQAVVLAVLNFQIFLYLNVFARCGDVISFVFGTENSLTSSGAV